MSGAIGGFFAQIALRPDQASFDKSKKELDSVRESVKKTGAEFTAFVGNAVKGLLAIGGAAVGTAYAVNQIQGKTTLAASQAGIAATQYYTWGKAFDLLGIKADTFTGSMGKVRDTLAGVKFGITGDEYTKMAEQLALIRRPGSQSGEDITQYIKYKATGEVDVEYFTEKLLKTLESTRGTAGHDAYLKAAEGIMPGISEYERALEGRNRTSAQQLGYAQAMAPMSAGNLRDAQSNMDAFNAVGTQVSNIIDELGIKLGTDFRPILEDLSKWISDHRDEISKFFDNVGKLLSNLVRSIGPMVETAAKQLDKLISGMAQQAEYSEIQQKDKAGLDKIVSNAKSKGVDLGNLQSNFGMIGGVFGNLTEGRNTYASQRQVATEAYKIANIQGYGKSIAQSVNIKDIQEVLDRSKLMQAKELDKYFLKDGKLGTYSGGEIKEGKVVNQSFNVTFNAEQTAEVVGLVKSGMALQDAIMAVTLTK